MNITDERYAQPIYQIVLLKPNDSDSYEHQLKVYI